MEGVSLRAQLCSSVGLLVYGFSMNDSVAGTHAMLSNCDGENTIWEKRFVIYSVCSTTRTLLSNLEQSWTTESFEDTYLKASINEYLCQRPKELERSVGVTLQDFSNLFKGMGMIQKQKHWVLPEMEPREVEERLTTFEQGLQMLKQRDYTSYYNRVHTLSPFGKSRAHEMRGD